MQAALPTGTVTFLFTDIEGSTKLWEAHPEEMRVALSTHDAILRSAIESAGGVVFKTVGDAFCAAFFRPQDALEAAIDLERSLARYAWAPEIGSIRVRAGIHTGTATESEGDYFGPTVNRVARLMSIGYGGQILVSSASAALLRHELPQEVGLRELGSFRLKDLSEAETTYQVVAPDLRTDFPVLKSIDSRPNNLPFQITGFVGREQELHDLRDALQHHRLVSIVGPGGIGKTRLAVHLAAEIIDGFADGAWLVSLSPLRRPELIAQATAEVLRIREEPREPLETTIVTSLAGRELLIIMDSSEHLVPGTAAFVKHVLGRCGSVRFLVTSREPLHVTGERVLRLQALQRAGELFADRARETLPDFTVDARSNVIIDEICARLDGIPLAIELAAARVATLPLPQLAARLSKRLNVLVSRDPTKEERHRTLRATIAWSHGLLDAGDADVFRALAPFDGSFDVAAVASIAGRPEDDALDVVEALAAKSLVSFVAGARAGAARYVVSDTVHEYLGELAAGDPAGQDLYARHFAFYAPLGSPSASASAERDIGSWLRTIDREISNIRAALEWALRERPSEAAALAAGLSRYWKIRGRFTEGRTWFRRILESAEVTDGRRAALLRRAATFATEQDAHGEARSLANESRALYERLGDVGGQGEARHTLAVIEQRSGHPELASDHYRLAIENFRAVGHDYGEALALMNVVLLAFEANELKEAEARIEEAAAAAARTGNEDLRGHIATFRGSLALRRGEFEQAEHFYGEALRTKVALGNRADAADISNSLAAVYARQGRLAEARAAAAQSIRIGLDLDTGYLVIFGFEAFSEIAVLEERFEDAARYYAFARQLRHAHAFWSTNARRMSAVEQTVRAQLGDRFDAIVAGCSDVDWRTLADALAEGRPIPGALDP